MVLLSSALNRLLIEPELFAAPIFGQALSQGERDYAVSALHATRKLFLELIWPLSEAQLKMEAGRPTFGPSPKRRRAYRR